MQQGDIKLFQTENDGDINVVNGLVDMNGGLETSAYLSLFGGNEDDDGIDGSSATWWGNLDEDVPARLYRSETQHLLQSIPATSSNLRRIEDAANSDLAWFIEEGVATSVTVEASIPALNKIKLDISIDQNSFGFVENWRSST